MHFSFKNELIYDVLNIFFLKMCIYWTPSPSSAHVRTVVAYNVKKNAMVSSYLGSSKEWHEWSEWTNCSETCGGGVQQRFPTCFLFSKEKKCNVENTQSQACNPHTCRSKHALFRIFIYKQIDLRYRTDLQLVSRVSRSLLIDVNWHQT